MIRHPQVVVKLGAEDVGSKLIAKVSLAMRGAGLSDTEVKAFTSALYRPIPRQPRAVVEEFVTVVEQE